MPFGLSLSKAERLNPIIIAAILGIAVCAGAAHAASAQDAAKSDHAAPTVERDKPAGKKAEKPWSDVTSCRRDAVKLHGPERARFMTQCIRKRD
jgi:hypothetical protein